MPILYEFCMCFRGLNWQELVVFQWVVVFFDRARVTKVTYQRKIY